MCETLYNFFCRRVPHDLVPRSDGFLFPYDSSLNKVVSDILYLVIYCGGFIQITLCVILRS